MLIDTHCHLDFNWFDDDRDEVVGRAGAAGVERIIVPATGLDNCAAVLELAERYECVFAAVGVHPNSSADWQDDWIETLRHLASHEKVVAIGEIGLDYYRDRSPRRVQQQALVCQLELAASLELPVILHNRESSEDLTRLLAASPLIRRSGPGVLHSFSASRKSADLALEMGFYLGFTGPITYKSADELRSILAEIPMERLLVETDAPFLAPQQHRGKRNEPAYVALVAEKVGSIRGMTSQSVAEQTSANAIRLFGERLR